MGLKSSIGEWLIVHAIDWLINRLFSFPVVWRYLVRLIAWWTNCFILYTPIFSSGFFFSRENFSWSLGQFNNFPSKHRSGHFSTTILNSFCKSLMEVFVSRHGAFTQELTLSRLNIFMTPEELSTAKNRILEWSIWVSLLAIENTETSSFLCAESSRWGGWVLMAEINNTYLTEPRFRFLSAMFSADIYLRLSLVSVSLLSHVFH